VDIEETLFEYPLNLHSHKKIILEKSHVHSNISQIFLFMWSAHSITSTSIQFLVDICVKLKINIPKKIEYILYKRIYEKISFNQIC
jgi:hypothetical protein